MLQLPELYSKHLNKQFNYPQYLILVILIKLLQNLKTVRLEEFARRFPYPIEKLKCQTSLSSKPTQERISIEHINRRLKIFKIIAGRYRNRRCRYQLRCNLIAALYNYDLSLAV